MAGKARVHELAKELGISSKQVLSKLQDLGEYVKSPSSTVEAPVARRLRESMSGGDSGGASRPRPGGRPRPAGAVPGPSAVPQRPTAPRPGGTAPVPGPPRPVTPSGQQPSVRPSTPTPAPAPGRADPPPRVAPRVCGGVRVGSGVGGSAGPASSATRAARFRRLDGAIRLDARVRRSRCVPGVRSVAAAQCWRGECQGARRASRRLASVPRLRRDVPLAGPRLRRPVTRSLPVPLTSR